MYCERNVFLSRSQEEKVLSLAQRERDGCSRWGAERCVAVVKYRCGSRNEHEVLSVKLPSEGNPAPKSEVLKRRNRMTNDWTDLQAEADIVDAVVQKWKEKSADEWYLKGKGSMKKLAKEVRKICDLYSL